MRLGNLVYFRRLVVVAMSVVVGSLWLSGASQAQMWAQIVAENNLPIEAVSADQVPRYGTFWSIQRTNFPPLPFNPFPDLSLYYLGWGNSYLVDDSSVDYEAIYKQREVERALRQLEWEAGLLSDEEYWALEGGGAGMMSSLASSHGYSNAVYLIDMASSTAGAQTTASFSIAGGTNNVPYDILTSTNVAASISDWSWLGIGYTSNGYTFSNQPPERAFYLLAKPQKTMIVGWGNDVSGQCDVPSGITNAIMVAGGGGQSLALLNNGTVIAWGQNAHGQGSVPTNVVGVTMIAAGWWHDVALLTNGTVIAWGYNGAPVYNLTAVPADLTNVTVISAHALHSLALRSDGMVAAWGYNDSGVTNVPSGLSNVMAIAAGYQHNLAVKTNGVVVAWGVNGSGQCNVPSGLSNVQDVAAGLAHSLALRSDGTVSAWGDNSYGETNVPVGLSNVVAIAAGGDPYTGSSYSLALKRDGVLAAWGHGEVLTPLGGLSNVIAIASDADHALAIRSGPRTPVFTLLPTDQYQIIGGSVSFTAEGVGLYGVTYQWQFNGVNIVGATNSFLSVTNVQVTNEGNYRVLISTGTGEVSSAVAALQIVRTPQIVSTSPNAPSTNWFTTNVTLTVAATAVGTNSYPISYQWKRNGNVITNVTSSICNLSVTFSAGYPWYATFYHALSQLDGDYSVEVSNAAGVTNFGHWQLRALIPGTVGPLSSADITQIDRPTNATNIIAAAAGEYHSTAVCESGTVVQWGYEWATVPTILTNATAVSAGYNHTLALRTDGTVVAWGLNSADTNTVPTNNFGVKAISAGWYHNVALLTNGSVTAWGNNAGNIGWNLTQVPASLTNATAVAAGVYHSLALRADGAVVGWGYNASGQTNPPSGLSNVVAVTAGGRHSLALKADGTVVAWGDNNLGQCSVPAGLSNVMSIAAGWEHSVALKNNGQVIAWGDNSYGQTNIMTNLPVMKLVAAGGKHTLVVPFDLSVEYPVDASKDLLLIYNTNSMDSSNVWAYYMQHRPMINGANVLGIGCITNELVYESDFTNQIRNPLAS